MEELIKQAFQQVDTLGPRVQEGHYDLVGQNGGIITPQVWENAVKPGWSIKMVMWPVQNVAVTIPKPLHTATPHVAGRQHHAVGVPAEPIRARPAPRRGYIWLIAYKFKEKGGWDFVFRPGISNSSNTERNNMGIVGKDKRLKKATKDPDTAKRESEVQTKDPQGVIKHRDDDAVKAGEETPISGNIEPHDQTDKIAEQVVNPITTQTAIRSFVDIAFALNGAGVLQRSVVYRVEDSLLRHIRHLEETGESLTTYSVLVGSGEQPLLSSCGEYMTRQWPGLGCVVLRPLTVLAMNLADECEEHCGSGKLINVQSI